MGVWIETINFIGNKLTTECHTLRGCVDWNYWQSNLKTFGCVTPCVGVWIETHLSLLLWLFGQSHPAWVCGLKLMDLTNPYIEDTVTPCVGVWIETKSCTFASDINESHPAWVCGLKLYIGCIANCPVSHTLRGCVDWNYLLGCNTNSFQWSHPAWVCGLKHRIASKRGGRFRHTLRGCIWIEALFTRWSSLWKNCKHSASCVFLFKLL